MAATIPLAATLAVRRRSWPGSYRNAMPVGLVNLKIPWAARLRRSRIGPVPPDR
jgi:hypothetical protein